MKEVSDIAIIAFMALTFLTLLFFYKGFNSRRTIVSILLWMMVTGILGYLGFYQDFSSRPPRFLLLIAPGILVVLVTICFVSWKRLMPFLNLKWLTILHVIRVPVEIILYLLFLAELIPESMTFEGSNFDIVSGISAPIIYFVVLEKKWIGPLALLVWNIICLGLLLNILTIAILSAKTPFQQWAFDQPNIGVTYFPFVWLPAIIVPVVLFCHLASIKSIVKSMGLGNH